MGKTTEQHNTAARNNSRNITKKPTTKAILAHTMPRDKIQNQQEKQ